MQVWGPRALIWVAPKDPLSLAVSPGGQQEDLGVTLKATPQPSCQQKSL